MKPAHFSLEGAIRPNVIALPKFITSTSDEIQARRKILLDANENSLGTCLESLAVMNNNGDTSSLLGPAPAGAPPLNRYPSASQAKLKGLIVNSKKEWGITEKMVCLGTGAADIIDLIIRVTCRPGQDAILITPPTFGLYMFRAALNGAQSISCPLDASFKLQPNEIEKTLDGNSNVKLIFLASPGNPTGTLIPLQDIQALLDHPGFKGYVVVDEAYIDYANYPDKATALNLFSEYANLIVIQTFSKGPGLAGLRLGIAFAHPETIRMLEKVQVPYCIPTTTSILAQAGLSPDGLQSQRLLVQKIIANREALVRVLTGTTMADLGVGKPLGAGEANFILLPILKHASSVPDSSRAGMVCDKLEEDHNIAVRYVAMMPHCEGCLRITVGTEEENRKLVDGLKKVLSEI
ncbi:histidinol-phosphate transaminase [Paecilomyces lecythidis]|uniref:histidinol-phosphate transaminase n=1 Tax=Paecilomyces lecythidis TaxID=3004212 RepID=A0ABR3YDK8_9EURO